MTVLLAIVSTYLLVIYRSNKSIRERVPYVSVFFLTALLATFVVVMMYSMDPPE